MLGVRRGVDLAARRSRWASARLANCGPGSLLGVRRRLRRGQEGLHPGGHQPPLDPAGEVGWSTRVGRARAARRPRPGTAAGSMTTTLPVELRARAADPLLGAHARWGCRPARSGASRASALSVAGPQVPSGGIPTLRWNSLTARSVAAPKSPSTRPTLKPRSRRRRCRAMTSSPDWRLPGQVHQHPVAERPARLVEGAVGRRADDAVGGQAALLLEGPDRPLDVGVVRRRRRRRRPASREQPDAASRSRSSRHAAPRSPARRTAPSARLLGHRGSLAAVPDRTAPASMHGPPVAATCMRCGAEAQPM